MKYTSVMLILLSLSLAACKKESFLEGNWKATWQTSSDIYTGVNKELSYTMDGIYEFKNDRATVIGYGYQGCIFSSDTIKNTLAWKATGDSLFLINEEESFTLNYGLEKKSDREIILHFMDDILITLEKQ